MKKVLVFGTFDLLHDGHLSLFGQARKYGDYLVAVVAKDKTVNTLKNRAPLRSEKERLAGVQNCYLVNEAVLGNEDNPYRIIKEVNPDVICLGYDQKYFTENLEKELLNMRLNPSIYRMLAYYPQKYHSSIIRNTIKQQC